MLKYGKNIIYPRLDSIVVLRISKIVLMLNSSHFLEESIEYSKIKSVKSLSCSLGLTAIILYKKILIPCIRLFGYEH